MNLANNPTKDQLKQVLSMGSNPDIFHYVLWVDHQGNVYLSAVSQDETPVQFYKTNESKIKFRLETFARGSSKIGTEAVNDTEWVQKLFDALVRLWNSNSRGYCDMY